MSKIWPTLGSIILLTLILGGASYILPQFLGGEDEPEAQTLEEVSVDAEAVAVNEAVVEEISSGEPVQAQAMVAAPTPVVTETSSLSSTQPYLKLTSLTRVDRNIYPCDTPHFSPSGDKFL